MCEKCFEKGYKKFSSQTDFQNFEKVLDLKCQNKILEINTQSNELTDFRMYYQCTNCNEKWVMSIPDNAWRGYFLTEQDALDYHLLLERENKYGCTTFTIIVAILTTLIFLFFK